MDKVIKATAFDGKIRITMIDTTLAVQESIKIHDLSPLAADILGRGLSVGSYISTNIKYEKSRFNLVIDGKGPAGRICVSGMSGGRIKGFIENPLVNIEQPNKADAVKQAVGQDGEIVVLKDIGLKTPYIGRCDLVSGNIAEDFVNYLDKSEGISSGVCLGVVCTPKGCAFSYGLFVEAMPGATDEMLFIADDIISNLNTSPVIFDYDVDKILDFHFGHLKLNILGTESVRLYCDCNFKIKDILSSLGKDELVSILNEQGKIEMKCDYCAKQYVFTKDEIDNLFKEE